MPEMTSYEPGTPSWIDFGTPDMDTAISFYEGLFGWKAEEADDSEAAGGYRMFTRGGKFVAGGMPIQDENQPAAWTTYVTVEDVDASVATAKEVGGQVTVEPMDVMTAGRMAVLMDPEGAVFALWQPGEHIGAGIVNEYNTLTWNELRTRDPEAAKKFYGTLFGWDGLQFGAMEGYTVWTIGDVGPEQGKGGMIDMAVTDMPEGIPPHWDVTFSVEDADQVAAKCRELGGTVAAGPIDIPMGRMYALQDPGGAVFTAMTFNQAS
jgi:predicted enzyme related to lactoylglutathione lyase